LDVIATIADPWREALAALSGATVLDVVGYRFPPEDAYGRFLIREALRTRPPAPPPRIRYFALEKDRASFESAFRELFGPALNYEYGGLVEPAL
jgi:hypothetical protein